METVLDFKTGGTGIGIGRTCTEDDSVQIARELQIFAGRGGRSDYGADLSFCNVSDESQKIGLNGGRPDTGNLFSIYRYTSGTSGLIGSLFYIDKYNDCYYDYKNNLFSNNIFFYQGSTTSNNNEGIIKYQGSTCYLYFHNPAVNSNNIGAYQTNVGTIWAYSAANQLLTLKAGYASTSDKRLKYDFNEFENWDDYYNFYMSLKPQTFKYNNDTREETYIGLIAQDVANSIVDNNLNNEKLCVVKCKENDAMEDGREYSIAYQEFISLNIKMIQKQEKEIQELKSIIEEQQKLLDELLQEQ